MRRAARLAAVLVLSTVPAAAQTVTGAHYAAPTTRYPHGALGDNVEMGALVLEIDRGADLRIVLPQTRVFEDTAPRLADLDGDGNPEAITVESHVTHGSRLAVYGPKGLVAATDWIGRRFRWLAPIGATDLDGDGRIEIAYVDRPHLARVLRVVRLEGGSLVGVADLEGVTNHRFGDREISGGVRECGQGAEMVVADTGWTRLRVVTLKGGHLAARDIGPLGVASAFDLALACKSGA